MKTCTGTAIHHAAWPRPAAESQILDCDKISKQNLHDSLSILLSSLWAKFNSTDNMNAIFAANLYVL